MAIELTDHEWPSKIVKSGMAETISIPSGQYVKIETGPDGEEWLNITSPPGENWTARIIVELTRTGF